MKDFLGNEMKIGDKVVMWSDNKGGQLLVEILDYNPDTGKIKVERQDDPVSYQMKIFWTNYFKPKFYKIEQWGAVI